LAVLEEETHELRNRRQTTREIDSFIGELRAKLATIEASDQTGSLAT